MVQVSKVPLICRRAFYADLATAAAAVGMGSAADAAALAALAPAEPAPVDPDYADLDPQLIVDLVAANHILAHNGVLDSFGHVSVRDPRNPHRYLQMQAIALGGPINYLNKYEQAKTQNVDRPWDTWRKQVGAG